MHLKLYGKRRHHIYKALRLLFLGLLCLPFAASGQNIQLSLQNTSLENVFKEIESKSAYRFVYTREELNEAKPVSVEINQSIQVILQRIFTNQPLSYSIEGIYIVVSKKPLNISLPGTEFRMTGIVVNENHQPIEGASVQVKGKQLITSTNNQGRFQIDLSPGATLLISSVGFKPREVLVADQNHLKIILTVSINQLDEAVVMAYGTTTQRFNTGSISKVSSNEISKNPVSNPLTSLIGRVPGLSVTPFNGIAGSAIKVELRGRTSIGQVTNPLFIIDGVPFAAGNEKMNTLLSAAVTPGNITEGGLSPFNSLNPDDIESIEVLKDADATAIYGSRGANGVILITTKKGKAGKMIYSVNISSGWGKATAVPEILNTSQYLKMRREAFANDTLLPTIANAPDLLVYDSNRYTDYRKLLTGGTARTSNMLLSASGGGLQTRFSLNGSYYRETSVFPGDNTDNRLSFRSNLFHQSVSNRLKLDFTAYYASEVNKLAAGDLTQFLSYLAPNLPELLDATGKPVWEYNGVSLTANPLAYLSARNKTITNNLLANVNLSYLIMKGLTARISAGYNSMLVTEQLIEPKFTSNPVQNPDARSDFANSHATSWILEPQLEFFTNILKGKLTALLGTTLQENLANSQRIAALGFPNDALLESLAAASTINITNNRVQYRYTAAFGRLNYNYANKYILNLSGRRDGSSRFGPGKQFGNFGAAGLAWIFTSEKFFPRNLSFISFGKIRASYGVTGSDNIGNYSYLDSWTVTTYPYQGSAGIRPTALFNADYGWETNRKLEAGIDLGFLSDQLLFSTAWYRNRSGNQLVRYNLPTMTGFFNITRNFPALVENSGWEFSISKKQKSTSKIGWSFSFNISFNRNKLVDYPGIESSPYKASLKVGHSLNLYQGYHLIGVDPEKGTYQFEDVNKDGIINNEDFTAFGTLDPAFFGGFSNSFTYGPLELSFLIDFRSQKAYNYHSYQSYVPGSAFNQATYIFNRWSAPGDHAKIQKFTTTTTTAAYKAFTTFQSSDGIISDASFIRLRNIMLSWNFPKPLLNRLRIQNGLVFFQGQNLATYTAFPVADPEIRNHKSLPPLKMLAAGIKLTF